MLSFVYTLYSDRLTEDDDQENLDRHLGLIKPVDDKAAIRAALAEVGEVQVEHG